MTTAGEHVLPAVLASFRQRHPGVDLRLDVGTREHVWSLLSAHAVDLVIAGRPPRALGAIVRAVRANSLVVVGSPAAARTFAAGHSTWLMREAGSGTRATCEALLAGLDADPPTLTLGSHGAVVAGAIAGLGVALVSRDAVSRFLAAGDLRELPMPHTPMRRPWHAVTPPRESAAAGLLLATLLDQDGWHSPVRSTRRGM